MATAKAIKGTRKTAAVFPTESVTGPAFDYASLLEEIAAELHRNVGEWLPRAVDDKGGFYQAFDRDWKRPKKEDPRFVVYQARMTWVAATYLALDAKTRKSFENYAQHGLAFLSSRQWDLARGGFYDHVAKDGKPVTDDLGQIKSIYGNSFGVYALAALYRTAGDLFALDLGFEAFEWIDSFAHDDVNGGYFNAVALDGKPLPADGASSTHDTKAPGIKLANTHIHLLEAFIELLRAAPHVVVRERVQELVMVLRDKLATPEGYLIERVTEDWQPLSKTTSFGHDVEAAFLLMEAADALGTPADEQTRNVARSLVDHALKFGLEREDRRTSQHSADLKGKIVDATTRWWACSLRHLMRSC